MNIHMNAVSKAKVPLEVAICKGTPFKGWVCVVNGHRLVKNVTPTIRKHINCVPQYRLTGTSCNGYQPAWPRGLTGRWWRQPALWGLLMAKTTSQVPILWPQHETMANKNYSPMAQLSMRQWGKSPHISLSRRGGMPVVDSSPTQCIYMATKGQHEIATLTRSDCPLLMAWWRGGVSWGPNPLMAAGRDQHDDICQHLALEGCISCS